MGSEIIKSSFYFAHEKMLAVGFSSFTTTVAEVAARLGARRLLQIHGAPPDVLQTIFKASAADTPRTVADVRSANIIEQIIAKTYPNAGRLDEELESTEGSRFKFYSDPLDGTSSYAAGQRNSTTGIAVHENGQPLSAAICHPFERELFVAERGKGAYLFPLNEKLAIAGLPRKLNVAQAINLERGIVFLDASFYSKNGQLKLNLMNQLYNLSGQYLLVRQTGSNIDQQRQVAAGRGLVTITDTVGGPYDIFAGALIIEEAGGKFVGMDGNPITEQTQVAIGGNSKIVNLVLPLLQQCYNGYEGFK